MSLDACRGFYTQGSDPIYPSGASIVTVIVLVIVIVIVRGLTIYSMLSIDRKSRHPYKPTGDGTRNSTFISRRERSEPLSSTNGRALDRKGNYL